MLFKEIIAVYTENTTRPINTKYATTLQVRKAGTYNYHQALKG
jgi:hypothetical protein